MILLILKVFVVCVEYRSIDTDMEHFKESYLSFLEVHGSRVSEQMYTEIEEQRAACYRSKASMNEVLGGYIAGTVDYAEFLDACLEGDRADEELDFLDFLDSQVAYAAEDPENRFLLYGNGWSHLFGSGEMDLFCILMILLIIEPVYFDEIHDSMMKLLRICPDAGRIHRQKVIISVISVILAGGGTAVIDYMAAAWRYGLPGGDLPAQSLSLFSQLSEQVSLNGVFWTQTAWKTAGYLMLAMICIGLELLVQRREWVFTGIVAFVYLPLFYDSERKLLYTLEPWGSLSGSIVEGELCTTALRSIYGLGLSSLFLLLCFWYNSKKRE